MKTRRKNQIHKPNLKYNLSAALPNDIPLEPMTMTQAPKVKRWRGAMSEGIDVFVRNDTMELVPRPPNRNIVGCKWIFTNKFFPNGFLKWCKARLVAKGYNQQHGRKYT